MAEAQEIAAFLPVGLGDVSPTVDTLLALQRGEPLEEFDPLRAVAMHWQQARVCFGGLRQQFDSIRDTAGYMFNVVDYAETMGSYQAKLLEQATVSPDHANVAYAGVISNLLASAQFSQPIGTIIPRSGNHYGYDRSDEIRRGVIPAICQADTAVQVLGLASAANNPIAELQVYKAAQHAEDEAERAQYEHMR